MAFLGVVSWKLFVDAFRLISILSFLLCSLTFNFYSFSSLICILVSLYVLDRNQYTKSEGDLDVPNPYGKKKRVKEEEKLPPDVVRQYVQGLLDFVMYDVEDCAAVHNFKPIQNNTHCLFSKKAKLWGARDYDTKLTLEHNVSRSLPALLKFLLIGADLKLDGFVFELPCQEYHRDLDSFGKGVYRVLKCISDADPDRYSFGVESSFILLQPMYSFALHNISPETPHTDWECPKTERDHIRVAFKANDRGYLIRDTVIYPPAHDIVKPLVEGPGNIHEWWNVHNLKKPGDEEVGIIKREEVCGEMQEDTAGDLDHQVWMSRAEESRVDELREEFGDSGNTETGDSLDEGKKDK